MSQVITTTEAAKLADETLAFLLGLCEQSEGTERAQEIIKTEQARRAAAKAKADAERNTRTLEWNGFRITLVEADSNSRASKARVYAWGFETAALRAEAEALPEGKLKGEDPENDRAYARYNREYKKQAVAFAARVVPALIEAGLIERLPKAFGGQFSKYAGCSCPCSQGVVMNQGVFRTANGRRVDIHVSPIES